MLNKLTKGDHIFDGFAHRGYEEGLDGWRNRLPSVSDYASVGAARDTLAMFEELAVAQRRIWELEQELALWKPLGMQIVNGA